MFERSAFQNNHLLAALTSEVKDRLFPHFELLPLTLNKILHEPGDVLRYVYFPTDAIVSLLYVTESGASTEVSAVGNDGLVGLPLIMGGDSTLNRAIVLSPGYAYRLPGQQLKNEFNRCGAFQRLLLRYAQSMFTQIAQREVCNRYHSIEQQLCRLLLQSLDRLHSNHLAMTQELIANTLGVRRESVTEAAGKLHKQGVIEYSRGHISVLNRPKLEQLCCECYAVVKKESDRLLPGTLGHTQSVSQSKQSLGARLRLV